MDDHYHIGKGKDFFRVGPYLFLKHLGGVVIAQDTTKSRAVETLKYPALYGDRSDELQAAKCWGSARQRKRSTFSLAHIFSIATVLCNVVFMALDNWTAAGISSLAGILFMALSFVVPTMCSRRVISPQMRDYGPMTSMMEEGRARKEVAFVPYVGKHDPMLPSSHRRFWLDLRRPSEIADSDKLASSLLSNIITLSTMQDSLNEKTKGLWRKAGCAEAIKTAMDALCEADNLRYHHEKESGTRRGLEGVSYTDGSGRTLAVNAQTNEQGAVAEVERKREELLRPALDTTAEAITAGSVILA